MATPSPRQAEDAKPDGAEREARHVYFEGDWSKEGAALVETAATRVEEASQSTSHGLQVRAPWVAVCHSQDLPLTEDGPIYVASRHGSVQVFRARSPEALAGKIQSSCLIE